MKIIYATVSSGDGTRVTDVLNGHQFSVVRLAITDGFLKEGNPTLLIGAREERVNKVIELIKNTCDKYQKTTCNVLAPNVAPISADYMMMPITVELDGVTIFVTGVERFEEI